MTARELRRYSKTDLRRGVVAPTAPRTPEVEAAEQAALFGEAAGPAPDPGPATRSESADGKDR